MIKCVNIKLRIRTEPCIKAATFINILYVLRHDKTNHRMYPPNCCSNRWKVVIIWWYAQADNAAWRHIILSLSSDIPTASVKCVALRLVSRHYAKVLGSSLVARSVWACPTWIIVFSILETRSIQTYTVYSTAICLYCMFLYLLFRCLCNFFFIYTSYTHINVKNCTYQSHFNLYNECYSVVEMTDG